MTGKNSIRDDRAEGKLKIQRQEQYSTSRRPTQKKAYDYDIIYASEYFLRIREKKREKEKEKQSTTIKERGNIHFCVIRMKL